MISLRNWEGVPWLPGRGWGRLSARNLPPSREKDSQKHLLPRPGWDLLPGQAHLPSDRWGSRSGVQVPGGAQTWLCRFSRRELGGRCLNFAGLPKPCSWCGAASAWRGWPVPVHALAPGGAHRPPLLGHTFFCGVSAESPGLKQTSPDIFCRVLSILFPAVGWLWVTGGWSQHLTSEASLSLAELARV